MNETPDHGPHHSGGHNTILIEFVAQMVPHDSPEFLERQRRGRPPAR